MRTQESQMLAQKIIDASEGYIIIPNWDAENYKDNVARLIDDITDLLCRDLRNNGSKDREEKIDMLSDYIGIINRVLKDFEEEHKTNIEPFQQQLREKEETFVFDVKEE